MTQSPLPLFYRDPRPLSSVDHAAWRLVEGDAAFAAATAFAPLVIGEFAPVARHYPIVFVAEDASPVMVLGLEEANLFVDDGGWAPDTYVPAYVRRYPFGFMPAGEDRFALAIDIASERVVREGEAGMPLFEGAEPSAQTRQALAFCEAYHGEAAMTRAFSAALREQKLLEPKRADATLPGGRRLGLDGFEVVDPARFAALPDAVVVDWHRRGWLGLVQHHLTSLARFEDLLARQSRRDAARAAEPERIDA